MVVKEIDIFDAFLHTHPSPPYSSDNVLYLDYEQSLIFLRVSEHANHTSERENCLPRVGKLVASPRGKQFSRALTRFAKEKLREPLVVYSFPSTLSDRKTKAPLYLVFNSHQITFQFFFKSLMKTQFLVYFKLRNNIFCLIRLVMTQHIFLMFVNTITSMQTTWCSPSCWASCGRNYSRKLADRVFLFTSQNGGIVLTWQLPSPF